MNDGSSDDRITLLYPLHAFIELFGYIHVFLYSNSTHELPHS